MLQVETCRSSVLIGGEKPIQRSRGKWGSKREKVTEKVTLKRLKKGAEPAGAIAKYHIMIGWNLGLVCNSARLPYPLHSPPPAHLQPSQAQAPRLSPHSLLACLPTSHLAILVVRSSNIPHPGSCAFPLSLFPSFPAEPDEP